MHIYYKKSMTYMNTICEKLNKHPASLFKFEASASGANSRIYGSTFYDNCRNSCVLINKFLLSISERTHEFIIYAMRQRTRADNLRADNLLSPRGSTATLTML